MSFRGNFNNFRGFRGRFPRGGRYAGARGRGSFSRPESNERKEEFPPASGGPPAGGEAGSAGPPPKSGGGNKSNVKTEVKNSTGMPNLAPKALSTVSSVEKNDPMINEAILIEGVSGFVERTRVRSFSNDFSQFIELVRASYNAQITFDRGLKKFLSFGMYQYYCVILLWRRLLYVISQRGQHMQDYDRLVRTLNFDVPEPADVALYLNGVGDITDFSDRHFQFELQVYPTDEEFIGARGTYGQVAPGNAIMYETVPAPFIAIEKVRQDFMYTTNNQHLRDWDLPAGLRPLDGQAVLPTANLLGWSLGEKLTAEQLETYADSLIDEAGYGIVNIGNIPVNQNLIRNIAGLLENSKCKAITAASGTPTGSVAQVPYAMRASDDAAVEPFRGIGAKAAQTYCYAQASSHIASGSACFRYRVMRRRDNEMRDSSCYRFVVPVPEAWLAMENTIFMAGAVNLWNMDQYRISEQNGNGLATMVANRVRRKVTKD